jgi:hypothetical protein
MSVLLALLIFIHLIIAEPEVDVAAQYGQSFEMNERVIIKIKPLTGNFLQNNIYYLP